MFSVRGSYHHGVIVDPGAAASIIGVDTLRRYVTECLTPRGLSVTVLPSTNKLTSIDGLSLLAVGTVSAPLLLAGSVVYWHADAIGGTGSRCPSPS